LTTYTLAQALRRKSRLESELNDLIAALDLSKTYYKVDGPANIADIRLQISQITTEVVQLATEIQKSNANNGLVESLIRKNVLSRELAALKSKKERIRYGYEARKADTIVPVVHEDLQDGTIVAGLTEEYHMANDALQAKNAQIKITVE